MITIAIEETPFETRAAAFDQNDLPFSVFDWRDPRIDPRARSGEVHAAIVRSIDKSSDGLFLELSSGENAFLNLKKNVRPPALGARVNVRVLSERYADKLARTVVTEDPVSISSSETRLEIWKANLLQRFGEVEICSESEAASLVDAAFGDALNPKASLSGGGDISIEFTRGMVAVDVDRSGRKNTKSRQSVNADAVETLARQIALRRIGGIVVMDLVGVPDPGESKLLGAKFKEVLAQYDHRRPNVLSVNRLGLFELSLPRTDRVIMPASVNAGMTQGAALDGLFAFWRALTIHLSTHRGQEITARVSSGLWQQLNSISFDWKAEYSTRFGSRFLVSEDDELGVNAYDISS